MGISRDHRKSVVRLLASATIVASLALMGQFSPSSAWAGTSDDSNCAPTDVNHPLCATKNGGQYDNKECLAVASECVTCNANSGYVCITDWGDVVDYIDFSPGGDD